jgi:hypothetical protein
MPTKLKPLPAGTVDLARHWTLVDPGVINARLRDEWEERRKQHPEHRTVVVEIDYHFGDRDYSLAAYLCQGTVEHDHEAYFKEGVIRLAMASIEDVFGIAYWFADDWMMESCRENAKQEGKPVEEMTAYKKCFPFRKLFDSELARSAEAQDLGALTTTCIDLSFLRCVRVIGLSPG